MDNIKDKTHKVAVNNLGNKQSMTNTNTTQIDELRENMWYPKSWTTLKPIEVIISSGIRENSLVKQITWATFETAILHQLELAKIEAKIESYTATEMVCNKVKYSRSVDMFIDERLSELTKQKEELENVSK